MKCNRSENVLRNITKHYSVLFSPGWWRAARATLEILIPDFVKQTAEEKPVEGDELEVRLPRAVYYLIRRINYPAN